MKKRLFAAFVCLCMIVSLLPTMAFAEAGVQDSGIVTSASGLCEHHTQHDESCGYTEGTAEILCSHEHDESCGGLTDPEACNHTHDEACGYVPATAGSPCTYVCEICNAQDNGNPATPSDAQPEECTCETLCTEEEINEDCPVCSVEGAELDKVCVGVVPMLPVTALAAGPNTVYVGGVALTGSSDGSVYATTNENGEVITEGATADNYNIKWDGSTLTLHNATIKKGLAYDENTPAGSTIHGSAIGVLNQSGYAELTVQLEGSNMIDEVSTGIYVHSSGGGAALSIAGNGTLFIDSTFCPIQVISFNGNAALSIENAKVTATSSYYNGVTVQSGNSENSSASLTVDGGSLTATAPSNNVSGIRFVFGSGGSGSGTPNLTVSGNATVRANGSAGGITSNSSTGVQYGTGGKETGGIIWNGTEGTVYGNVTLQEDITIGEGESLTIGDGASLNTGIHEVIVNGGTLNGADKITGTVKYAPVITTASLPDGEMGTAYSQIFEATGDAPVTWSVTSGSLPAGLSLSEDGKISGTPTAEGTSTFTVTATNSIGSDSRKFTLKIEKPAFIPVTGLELNKNSLTLQEKGSDILTVTVKPADATNQDVTWESSNTSIATVSADGTVTAISAGTATITATAKDGSVVSASCTLTVTHGKMVHIPKKDATCTEYGNEEYWICENCGKYFSDANGDTEIAKDSWIISAINHDWNDAVYTWSDDGSTCTATRTCKNDSAHTETSKATVTGAQTKAPTCTEKGETTYTATFEADWAVTQTKVIVDIPATGHSYGEPEWSWSEDGKTCTVTFTCEKDETHKESPKVDVTSAVKTPATCTETGVTTYTATVEFNGQTYTDTKDVADIPATGHSYDNGKCTVCGAIASDFKVIITAGANGSWQKGTKDGLTFTSNAAYKHFQKVQVDGKDLDASNYTVKEGSTIVTLKTSYLETLSVGKHTLAIVSETGTATTEFTIKAAASANDRNPANPNGEATESVQTGDNTNMMLWIVMLFVSASILGIAIYEKRKKHMEN